MVDGIISRKSLIVNLFSLSILATAALTSVVNALEVSAPGTNQVQNITNNMQVDSYKRFTEAFILNYTECAKKSQFYSPDAAKKCVQTVYDEFIANHNACSKQGKIYDPTASGKCVMAATSAVPDQPPPNLDSINSFIASYKSCAATGKLYTPGGATTCTTIGGSTSVVNNPTQTINQVLAMVQSETLTLSWENVGGGGKDGQVSTSAPRKLCLLSQVTYSGTSYTDNGRVFCKLTGKPGTVWTMTGKVARGDVVCEAKCYDW